MHGDACVHVCDLACVHGPLYACDDGCVHDGVHACAHVDVSHYVCAHVTAHEDAYEHVYGHLHADGNACDADACDDDLLVYAMCAGPGFEQDCC